MVSYQKAIVKITVVVVVKAYSLVNVAGLKKVSSISRTAVANIA